MSSSIDSVLIFLLTLKFTSSEKPLNYRPNSKYHGETQDLIKSDNVNSKNNSTDLNVHSRQKRFVWITDDGLIAFPPGTSLVISPTLQMPFFRNVPKAFGSNLGINTAFTIDFDNLGITSVHNPFGIIKPGMLRSMARSTGSILANYVKKFLSFKSRKRRDMSNEIEEVENDIAELPEEHKHAFHGGERAILYTIAEEFIESLGMNGRSCLLRSICEIQTKSIERYGLLGEMFKLFLTASLSPYSDLLDEYVEAEKVGKSFGDCSNYQKDCKNSLFKSRLKKVPVDPNLSDIENNNEIP